MAWPSRHDELKTRSSPASLVPPIYKFIQKKEITQQSVYQFYTLLNIEVVEKQSKKRTTKWPFLYLTIRFAETITFYFFQNISKMGEVYRIKLKTENFEMEVEGPSKEFVETYAARIMQEASSTAAPAPAAPQKSTASKAGTSATRSGKKERAARKAETTPAKEVATVATPTGAKVVITEEGGEQVAIVMPQPSKRRKRRAVEKTPPKPEVIKKAEASAQEAEKIDPEQVAAAIRNSEYYPIIKEKVLEQRNQLNKILIVAYYILKTYHRRPATVGTFESITELLGVPLKSSNISTQIKKRLDLFDVVDVKRRRLVKGFILNSNGVKYVENNILNT